MQLPKRLTGRVGTLVLAGFLLAAWPAPQAAAAEVISSYTVKASVAANGVLDVKASIVFEGSNPDHVTQVFDTSVRTANRTAYQFTLDKITATGSGKPLPVFVERGGEVTTVRITTAGSTGPVELSYQVRGAALATADDTTTLTWPLLQGLSYPVAVFDATLGVPGPFLLIDCAAGDPVSPGACTYYGGGTHLDQSPVFRHEAAKAGDVVIVTLRFPRSVVAVNEEVRELWSLDRAFSTEPLPLWVAIGLLVVGALALGAAHNRVGRDRKAAPEPTLVADFHPIGANQVEFRPLGNVRPGAIGTLADERVDPVDITATLLDLAVRGHLLISELPRESAHAPTDWAFSRRTGSDELLPYERTLLDALAGVQGEPVKVSNLAGGVHAALPSIQSQLYDEVVSRGWFSRRPDATRHSWTVLGWVLLVISIGATLALAAFTKFGLAGVAASLISLGVLFIAQEMPARTTSGTSVLMGLDVLRGSLLTQPVDQLPGGAGHLEVSRILPYATVLGGRQRWLQALADSQDESVVDAEELSWYHGPEGWQLSDLPASLANFVTTVQGALFSR